MRNLNVMFDDNPPTVSVEQSIRSCYRHVYIVAVNALMSAIIYRSIRWYGVLPAMKNKRIKKINTLPVKTWCAKDFVGENLRLLLSVNSKTSVIRKRIKTKNDRMIGKKWQSFCPWTKCIAIFRFQYCDVMSHDTKITITNPCKSHLYFKGKIK